MAGFEWEKLLNTVTFSSDPNSPGDVDGTGNPTNLFIITGDVIAKMYAFPSLDLFGREGKFWIGKQGNPIPVLNLETNIPEPPDGDELSIVPSDFSGEEFQMSSATLSQTVSGADVTVGSIKYYIIYAPLSVGATVELPVI